MSARLAATRPGLLFWAELSSAGVLDGAGLDSWVDTESSVWKGERKNERTNECVSMRGRGTSEMAQWQGARQLRSSVFEFEFKFKFKHPPESLPLLDRRGAASTSREPS